MSTDNNGATDNLLARGGGNATFLGTQFQASIGAIYLAKLLTDSPLEASLSLGAPNIRWIRFESESPLDDILIATGQDGFIAIQAKTTLSLSQDIESEFYKTVEQIVRHWLTSKNGTNTRDWDRPLDQNKDRMVIAVGQNCPTTVRVSLADALNRTREPFNSVPPIQAHISALDTFRANIKDCWSKLTTTELTTEIVDEILRLTVVVTFDVDGGHWTSATTSLENSLPDKLQARNVMSVLRDIASELLGRRSGLDQSGLRRALSAKGIELQAITEYQEDIAKLKSYGQRVHQSLAQYQKVDISQGLTLSIPRSSRKRIKVAAEQGSFLIIGEPGAGKSAAINDLAADLSDANYDVIQLAVDNLRVDSLGSLNQHLGIKHSLLEVLENWEGSTDGFILIDALDASRGGVSESIFRTLIEDIMQRSWRWRVIASIRSFDLQLGAKFKSLFKGSPPISDLMDDKFSNVRHVLVPKWAGEEIAYIESNAPALGQVISALPTRLKELVAIPFNLRLISELISSGVEANSLSSIHTEVGLLNLYWEHRVGGGFAEQACLKQILSIMISRLELRVEKLEILSTCEPATLQNLMEQGVLIESENGRYIQFRHHLLFDYAASRAYLSVSNLTSDQPVFEKKKTYGLMLAPALRFILREMWFFEAARKDFWKAVINVLKSDDTDPVMKSVASRICAELTAMPNDIKSLLDDAESDSEGVSNSLNHIAGALAVRAEDKDVIHCEPWAYFAANLAKKGINDVTAWPLRSILFILYERATSSADRNNIGIAARLLLDFGFENTQWPSMADAGIRFVSHTFETDYAESITLLRKVFEPDRFRNFAHLDLPTLANNIGKIIPYSPEFGIEVYAVVYGRDIEKSRDRSMSNSQIIPLITNTRQDYSMARYSLKGYFNTFLERYPYPATEALIYAVEGYIKREHTGTDPGTKVSLPNGLNFELVPDFSYIWASDVNGTYAEDAVELVVLFTKFLKICEPVIAEGIADKLILSNKSAWLWARLFMVSAQRLHMAPKLWDYAIQEQFIKCSDTLVDAVDLIKANYTLHSEEKNRRFEESIVRFDFSDYPDAEAARTHTLGRIARTLGQLIVTDELKSLLDTSDVPQTRAANERLYSIEPASFVSEDLFWFRDRSKLEVSPNKELKEVILRTKNLLQQASQSVANSSESLMVEVRQIISEIRQAKSHAQADEKLISHAEGQLADLCQSITKRIDFNNADHPNFADEILTILELDLAISKSPEVTESTESNFEDSQGWGAPASRITAAEITLDFVHSQRTLFPRLRPLISNFLLDSHPAVRMVTSSALTNLWEVDKEAMWQFATVVTENEKNSGVLHYFVIGFLNRVLHTQPETAEGLLISLYNNATAKLQTSKRDTEVIKSVASSLLMLSISHDRTDSKSIVDTFLQDPIANKSILTSCLHSLRSGLALGYGENNIREDVIRQKCQAYTFECANVMSSRLKSILDVPDRPKLSDSETEEARVCSELLDQVCREYFFAAGVSDNTENSGVIKPEYRPVFLHDIEPALLLIGEHGSPHTIYYLLQLLEYLAPSQPLKVFDLTCHALLNAGKKHGYQNEVLGADLMVRMVGQLIADHREIFDDQDRRQKLIECLESFQIAGWPAARKLLYRLPELLQ